MEIQSFEKRPPATNHDEIEVELAGGWERIGAVLLNNIFNILSFVPFIIWFCTTLFSAMMQSEGGGKPDISTGNILLGLFLFLISIGFSIYQLVILSKHGQTLGKKLLNIKVIKENGEPAGFVGAFLLREVVYWVAISFVLGILSAMFMPNVSNLQAASGNTQVMTQELMRAYSISSILNLLPYLICIVMMFVRQDRRTLQDLMGGTVVIKLPRSTRR